MKPRIAIIAALPREIRSLVRGWQSETRKNGIRIFSGNDAIVICAGMGADRAVLAATHAVSLGPVSRLISAGFVGALHDGLRTGAVVKPGIVIDARTGERFSVDRGQGILVTGSSVAGVAEKQRLRKSYLADAVDMEAAAVARIAEQRGIPFAAVKAVSDEHDFEMPEMSRFVSETGQFREVAFAGFMMTHPSSWPRIRRLAAGAKKAEIALTQALRAEVGS